MKSLILSTMVGIAVYTSIYAAVNILSPGKPTGNIKPVELELSWVSNGLVHVTNSKFYISVDNLSKPGRGDVASNFFYHNVPKDWILITSNYTLRGGQ